MNASSYADNKTVMIHLRDFPVPLAARARQAQEDVLREFALITADVVENTAPDGDHAIPLRLLDLVVTLTQELHELIDVSARRVEAAIEGGSQTIPDHVVELPIGVAAVTRQMADTWDEADQYCWSRDQLMELATPADIAAFRRWFFAQVLDQLDGRGPVPWPESAAARGL